MKAGDNHELYEIKSHLVNISLVTASIVGLPLLTTSLIRAFMFHIISYYYLHISIYVILLLVTAFRKKLSYNIRAYTIILIIFAISAIDFINTGFLSAGFLSFTITTIVAALYFSFRKSIWFMAASIIYITSIYVLNRKGLITYTVDYNEYAQKTITVVMLSLNIILYGLIVAFSIRHIHRNLEKIIINLRNKTTHLEKVTIELKNEIQERTLSEQKLISSEKNFRNIFEKSSDAILIVNKQQNILDFNETFIKLSGLTEKEIFSKPFDHLVIEEERNKINEYYKNLKSFPSRFEFQIDTSSKTSRFFDCTTSLINYNGEDAILLMIRDNTEKQNLEKLNYLNVIEAEEKEKSRFSKELHDGLGPLLSTLKIYFEIFFNNPHDNEIRERIETTLTESIKSVKEISNNLSPYILENLGLTKAINSFIDKVRFGKKLNIDLNSNLEFRLKPEIEISIYRFITELINNTIKHANASAIAITIEEKENKLEIRYSDNGIGFNISDISLSSAGIGLFNLRSRIEKLGGRIEMNTAPGAGFSIIASLKIDQAQ